MVAVVASILSDYEMSRACNWKHCGLTRVVKPPAARVSVFVLATNNRPEFTGCELNPCDFLGAECIALVCALRGATGIGARRVGLASERVFDGVSATG
jgi:hypothetical protein